MRTLKGITDSKAQSNIKTKTRRKQSPSAVAMAALNCILHPHHVNMGKHHTSIHTLHQHVEDPYYGLDKQPSHKGVLVPKFDVREDEDAFYLDGDVPGVSATGEIFTEMIGSITLIVRGAVKAKEGSEKAKIPEQHGKPPENPEVN